MKSWRLVFGNEDLQNFVTMCKSHMWRPLPATMMLLELENGPRLLLLGLDILFPKESEESLSIGRMHLAAYATTAPHWNLVHNSALQ